jgi:Domain of unknown function (DUF6487)
MTTPTPECPACRVSMQAGFVPDVAQNGRHLATRWIEGAMEKSFVQGVKVRGRRQLDTVTFRCPKCGWLIWFAPEVSDSDVSGG